MRIKELNEKSYNAEDVIRYYRDFVSTGLFHYEELLIDKYFLPAAKTLDIGCGAGRVTIPLFKKGYSVIGFDFSERMIQVARAINSVIDYRIGNILSTDFKDDEFDNIIFSFNGLMLVTSYEGRLIALKEIHRIIKKEGTFFFTTPYLDNKLEKPYWKIKANALGINVKNMTWEQQLKLGDEHLKDYGNDFSMHIPFLSEIKKILDEASMEVLFSARRLDYSGFEKRENDLDDNYLWVAICKK